MLMYENLGEYKVNASQKHGKLSLHAYLTMLLCIRVTDHNALISPLLLKCAEKIFCFLILFYKYQTWVYKNKWRITYAIYEPNVTGKVPGCCISCMCNISDLIIVGHQDRTTPSKALREIVTLTSLIFHAILWRNP